MLKEFMTEMANLSERDYKSKFDMLIHDITTLPNSLSKTAYKLFYDKR